MRYSIRSAFPEPVSGYELQPAKSYFALVVPEATENIVLNPSVEKGITTGYTAYNGTIAATVAWQAYGSYGLIVTPTSASTEHGFYYGTVSLTSGVTYTASITIQGDKNKLYYIVFASTAGTVIGTRRYFTGTGRKQRIWVTYTETSTTTRRVYVNRVGSYPDTRPFYADGLQVEAKSYPTTYCDGSLKSFVPGVGVSPYLWTGTPHASSSLRSVQTRSGGREVNLLDFGLHILAIVGLGMAPLVDQALVLPGRGEFAQGTGTVAREFTLVASILGDTALRLQTIRSNIITALSPDQVVEDQPFILRYQAIDDDDEVCSETLDILCKPRTGLEGNWDNHNHERVALSFKMHLPFIKNTYDSGTSLGYSTTVTNFANVGYRDTDGVWKALGTGTNGLVRTSAIGPDGKLVIAGDFTLAGGVANTVRIAKWNGSAWTPLGTGADGSIFSIAFDAAGNLYATGNFANIGGVAAAKVAKWDGTTWSAMGTGLNGGAEFGYAILVANNGYVWLGGSFADAGGVANTANIAAWNGSAWTSVGNANNTVRALATGPTGAVYAGGLFTDIAGVTLTNVGMFEGGMWERLGLGTGMATYTLSFGLDGTVYAGGVSGTYIMQYKGALWETIGIGADNSVFTTTIGPEGELYAGGYFTTMDGISLPDTMAVLRGGTWLPVDIDLVDAAAIVYTMVTDKAGRLYIAGDWTADSTALSPTTTVPNIPSAKVYPVVTFTGPGSVWQFKNYTTGKAIYINNLDLLAGETAVLSLDPEHISFVSSFRGNVMGYIIPGSNLLLGLNPGNNNISTFITGGTAATSVTMVWKNLYWSIDNGVIQ